MKSYRFTQFSLHETGSNQTPSFIWWMTWTWGSKSTKFRLGKPLDRGLIWVWSNRIFLTELFWFGGGGGLHYPRFWEFLIFKNKVRLLELFTNSTDESRSDQHSKISKLLTLPCLFLEAYVFLKSKCDLIRGWDVYIHAYDTRGSCNCRSGRLRTESLSGCLLRLKFNKCFNIQ